MILSDLKIQITTPIFSRNEVVKAFPNELESHINTQLHRMAKRGDLIGVKRGLYAFPNPKIDEFVVANKLYTPSYVSLESVLNTSGIIPDITSTVTSVTTVTSKKLSTPLGNFNYSKLTEKLFFGYKNVVDSQSGLYYIIATPEKALLDFIYIRKIKNLTEARVDIANLNMDMILDYANHFPKWVRKVAQNG